MAKDNGISVLIAEDDLEIAALVRKALTQAGYRTTLATDGEEALRSALADRPDLVVLDVMMPQMNGWEVCKALRARPDFDGTGILMLTAIGPNLNEMTAPLYGADDHLDKPFLIDELLERLRQLSERKAADRPAQLA
jgi:DNA-binding response OmpR family regulator